MHASECDVTFEQYCSYHELLSVNSIVKWQINHLIVMAYMYFVAILY